jgi:MoaA/NifB/PqqE/SkfB family radical SAM enzyme
MSTLDFVWLEVTGSCQLTCVHCYADASPQGTHGAMTVQDWIRVIDQASTAGAGMVQFIGGEPTLHPRLPDLIGHALGRGLNVEVFSNLYRITPSMWAALSQPGVSLATSFYSDDAGEHDGIVARPGAHARTTANIAEATRRGIPLRTGVIEVRDGQRVPGAVALLERLGVTDVDTDRQREVGRGVRDGATNIDQLCGNCASGVVAVAPDGTVWPCVFSRWLPVGNVRHESTFSQGRPSRERPPSCRLPSTNGPIGRTAGRAARSARPTRDAARRRAPANPTARRRTTPTRSGAGRTTTAARSDERRRRGTPPMDAPATRTGGRPLRPGGRRRTRVRLA